MKETLNEKQVEALKADFPPEALSEDKSRGFPLTSIKAAFVLERLNEVFGIGGWWYDFEPFTNHESEICTVVSLYVQIDPEGDPLCIKQAGGKRIVKSNVTDARKSAVTDGLTKCASVLGIGHTVFKGMADVHDSAKPAASKPAPQAQAPAKTDEKISAGKVKVIHTLLGKLDIKDDHAKHKKATEFLQKNGLMDDKVECIDSFNDLTVPQGDGLIEGLDMTVKENDKKAAPDEPPVEITGPEPF